MMLRSTLPATVLFAALFACACERERVEVADSDDGSTVAPTGPDAEPPVFPIGDGGAVDAPTTCGLSPPPLGRCSPCANGFVSLADGAATCDCCP